ncbi:MAG: tryptophan synthase subunit alpha [Spirochaetaceae bacterium]
MVKIEAPKLMTHMIAGFPDYSRALEIAESLVEGGADYLEIQFPFSDPSADGPIIEKACMEALAAGFRTKEGFSLVHKITTRYEVPVFIMSYASIVYTCGMDQFTAAAAESGATGLIVPDLPFDSDEGLQESARVAGLFAVPVVVPGMSEGRLAALSERRPGYIYTSLRTGITGGVTEIGETNISFLKQLRETGAEIWGGFGISRRSQIDALSGHLDTVVVGSEILRTIRGSLDRGSDVRSEIKEKVGILKCKNQE